MTKVQRFDAGKIARALANDATRFCAHFFPDGRRVGNYWQMGDVSGVPGRSLSIRLQDGGGRRAGKWEDYATGEYGDLLDLLRSHLDHLSYAEVLKAASDFAGTSTYDPDIIDPSPNPSSQSTSRAVSGRRLFSYGCAISGTLAERYLLGRSIERFGPSLAFHPSAYLRDASGSQRQFPALLGSIRSNDAIITGCVRLFLDPLGHGLAQIDAPKRVLGDLYGSGVRFGRWRTAGDLIVGEGLENTLSVGTALPHAALTACITANHLAGFIWPEHVERIWIAHDNDDAGRRAADTLSGLIRTSGREVHCLSPIRDDFNSDLVSDGVASLQTRLMTMIMEQAQDHDLWPEKKAA